MTGAPEAVRRPTPPRAQTRQGAVAALALAAICGACASCSSPAAVVPAGRDPDACPEPPRGVELGGVGEYAPDTPANPTRRLALMGGGPEDDAAARLFAEAADGGDVVVLRASGSLTSYPGYFLTTLSPDPVPASVVTIRTSLPDSAAHASVLCRLDRAEAVWLAGGDQWDYLGRWPAPTAGALARLAARGVAWGGASAGAVSLGEAAFDARFGTVRSAEALADPLRREVSIAYPPFAQPELAGTVVDSHFSERAREGRLLAFLARFLADRDREAVLGVGLDEGAALVVESGAYRVSARGGAAVWLYQARGPAALRPGQPLTLANVRRAALTNHAAGPWPPDFSALQAEAVEVVDGVVRARPNAGR